MQAKGEPAAGFRTRLVYMSGADNALPPNAVFNLPEHSTKLGSDSVRCDIVLKGPTISPVHAEIFTDNVQNYFVADRGSAAGTWLNYAPVSSLGTKLEHGDILHIAWSFRFEVANAKKRPIQVLPYRNNALHFIEFQSPLFQDRCQPSERSMDIDSQTIRGKNIRRQNLPVQNRFIRIKNIHQLQFMNAGFRG